LVGQKKRKRNEHNEEERVEGLSALDLDVSNLDTESDDKDFEYDFSQLNENDIFIV